MAKGLKITGALEGILRGDEFKILGRAKRNPAAQIGKFIKGMARINKDGSVDIIRHHAPNPKRKKRRNVAAGFWDDSGFHPIRASYDYSPARVGEGTRKRKPAKKRKAAKRKRR